MSSKTVLSFSVPATLAAFNDLALMQRWEVLRRAASELSVREFATAVGIDLGAAQAELDRLIDRLDVQHLAADRRVGETVDDAGTARKHLRFAGKTRRTEHFLDEVGSDLDTH